MSWVAAVAVMLAGAPLVGAHEYYVHGTILAPYADQADSGLFALLESLAPGAMPNGIFFYRIVGVQGGDSFTLVPDDTDPFVVGTADECPGPRNWDDELVAALQRGDAGEATRIVGEDAWVACNNSPDFEIRFTGGWCEPGPGGTCDCLGGACAGIVPGDGDAVVILFFGEPMSGFTYSEA